MKPDEIEWSIYQLNYHNKHFEVKGSTVYQAIEIAIRCMREEKKRCQKSSQ